jgi:hypothetical protein
LRTVLAVVLPGCSAADIPAWLTPASTTYYIISEYTGAGAEKLLRLLTRQPYHVEPPLGPRPVLPPYGAPDAVSPVPTPSGAAAAAASQPDSGPRDIEAIVRLLAQVSSWSETAPQPSQSWTPTQWMVTSTPLRLRLAALGRYVNSFLNESGSLACDVQKAMEVNELMAEIKDLVGNIGISLNYLQDNSSSPETRARESNTFTRCSADLQYAACQLRDVAGAAGLVDSSTISKPPELR